MQKRKETPLILYQSNYILMSQMFYLVGTIFINLQNIPKYEIVIAHKTWNVILIAKH